MDKILEQDRILEQNLSRVEAPAELWDRIQNPLQSTHTARPRRMTPWVLAAALPVLVAAWGLHPREKPMQAPAKLHVAAACLACHSSGTI